MVRRGRRARVRPARGTDAAASWNENQEVRPGPGSHGSGSCATGWWPRAYRPRPCEHLSMGMSHDFEAAIEEGRTMVRVGTAIFGKREKL